MPPYRACRHAFWIPSLQGPRSNTVLVRARDGTSCGAHKAKPRRRKCRPSTARPARPRLRNPSAPRVKNSKASSVR
jgi:hypothetical protein